MESNQEIEKRVLVSPLDFGGFNHQGLIGDVTVVDFMGPNNKRKKAKKKRRRRKKGTDNCHYNLRR